MQELTQADEFMVVTDVFDPALRLRSLEITAQAWPAGDRCCTVQHRINPDGAVRTSG